MEPPDTIEDDYFGWLGDYPPPVREREDHEAVAGEAAGRIAGNRGPGIGRGERATV